MTEENRIGGAREKAQQVKVPATPGPNNLRSTLETHMMEREK